ncbi:cAMP-specific 3',5'-cyclic phosphodiesterase 4D [Physocladia obscura]|uniref:Phosphodiesterase n=1 Tax=Physocladia obscura TaxID=109957 RepID=A0AAD5XI50_9FUNG|nr:cAMP-specific 3',5'-cyclic phosphodiesterase 4D [Physocladia obscura]
MKKVTENLSKFANRGFIIAKGKNCLALAEYERICGTVTATVKYYEAAIEEFKTNNSSLFEALALEKMAFFWSDAGMTKMSKMCFIEAANKWGSYGSNGKRNQIVSKFQGLFGITESIEMEKSLKITRKIKSEMVALSPIKKESANSTDSSNQSQSNCRSSRFEDSQTTSANAVSFDIDATTAYRVAQSIRDETSLDSLLRKIMKYIMVNTGATKGALILNDTTNLMIEAIAEFNDSKENIDVLQSHPITNQVQGFRLPLSVIYYTFRTSKSIVLTEPVSDATHGSDVYMREFNPKSILCCPIINQSSVTGVVYLENKLQGTAFTPKRIEIIQSLMPTAAIYIKNAKLTKTNTELTAALQDSGKFQNAPKYKIDAPVQRAIDVLNTLKNRMNSQGDPAVRQIDFIMASLTSSDLFMSSIDEINDENGRGIDQDTKNWIENSLLQKTSKSVKGQENDGDEKFTIGNHKPASLNLNDEVAGHPISSFSSIGFAQNMFVQNQEEINTFLDTSRDFDFDVFKLGDLTNGQPLYYLSMHLLQYYGLIDHFNIDPDVARAFFQEVEANYRNLSYHNSYHAADVLQTVNLLLLSDPQMAQNFTKLEILAACIASAVHDVDHPGVNNNYLIQSSHPLAILYNDLSVLEYHHASKAFEIMQSPKTNIFAKFSCDQKRDVRKQMINMVIATATTLKLEESADRALVLDIAIKCADLNNPAKSLEHCKSWAFKIMEEFFQQGDRERLNGLNVSMFMDRNDTNISKCQIGFIDILVTPLFESWSQCIETDFTRTCMKNISLNRAYWESILDKPDAIPIFQAPDPNLLRQELFETTGSPATLKRKLILKQKNLSSGVSQSKASKSPSSGPLAKNFQKPPLRQSSENLRSLDRKKDNKVIDQHSPSTSRRASAKADAVDSMKTNKIMRLPELPKSPASNL